MRAPASLNELISSFSCICYSCSDQEASAVLLEGGTVLPLLGVIFGPRCWWAAASVWPLTLYSGVHLLNPACSWPPWNPVPIQTSWVSWYGQPRARKWLRSLPSSERACEHMRNRAAQKRARTAAHSPAFTAAPFENTPVVSCSTLHFVLPPRTQRNVSVNSGDTLYK